MTNPANRLKSFFHGIKPHLTLKKLIFSAAFLFLIAASLMTLVNFYVLNASKDLIHKQVKDVPAKSVALVLGAKVYTSGKLSDILADRALTAKDLYDAGKVRKILVSGDNGSKKYDEVTAVKEFLIGKGVPSADIHLDYAGFDTYDSMYRARDVFKVDSMVIVTQEFHLPRAIYIAKSLGLDAVGLTADKHVYVASLYNDVREFFARMKAFIDVSLHAKPRFLGEPVPVI